MKTFGLLGFVLFLLPFALYGQANDVKTIPNFSGNWVFANSTDDFIAMKGGNCHYSSSMAITQTTSEIVIREKTFLELFNAKTGAKKTIVDEDVTSTYFLDGRGESNVAKGGTNFSTTEWKGSKLKTTFFTGPATERKRETVGTVVIEFAKDGISLKMTKSTPGGRQGSNLDYTSLQNGSLDFFELVNNRSDTFRLVSK